MATIYVSWQNETVCRNAQELKDEFDDWFDKYTRAAYLEEFLEENYTIFGVFEMTEDEKEKLLEEFAEWAMAQFMEDCGYEAMEI